MECYSGRIRTPGSCLVRRTVNGVSSGRGCQTNNVAIRSVRPRPTRPPPALPAALPYTAPNPPPPQQPQMMHRASRRLRRRCCAAAGRPAGERAEADGGNVLMSSWRENHSYDLCRWLHGWMSGASPTLPRAQEEEGGSSSIPEIFSLFRWHVSNLHFCIRLCAASHSLAKMGGFPPASEASRRMTTNALPISRRLHHELLRR